MFYFIPAWYPEGRTWYDDTYIWYRRPIGSRFDDSINQLRMFHTVGEACQLLVLNYRPNLRYYCHRYDLLEVDTWSVFDDIQGIGQIPVRILDYMDLDWPVGAEFINSPFLVMVRLQGQPYAQIEFGEEGQMVWVDLFEEGLISKKLVFDDRGFLSSILYYEGGAEHHQDYLGLDGIWRIREYLLPDDNHVEVNPLFQDVMWQSSYDRIEELIQERLTVYFSHTERQEGVIVLASDPRHNHLVRSVKKNRKLVLSFFGERHPVQEGANFQEELADCQLVVTDTFKKAEALQEVSMIPVQHQSLFDTRLALGKSQRLKELILYVLIDGLSWSQLKGVLDCLFESMAENQHIYLSLVSYSPDFSFQQEMEKKLTELLEHRTESYLFLQDQTETRMFEFGDESENISRIALHFLHSEMEIITHLDSARLIIDLADEPNLYTQIAGISAGIPQVNRVETEFVEHMKNGYILDVPERIGEAIDFYLTGLTNWNKSLIYSVQKIADYTKGVLVEKMKEKIE